MTSLVFSMVVSHLSFIRYLVDGRGPTKVLSRPLFLLPIKAENLGIGMGFFEEGITDKLGSNKAVSDAVSAVNLHK
jgi:hypothetical protein